jgi:hypothetical protein
MRWFKSRLPTLKRRVASSRCTRHTTEANSIRMGRSFDPPKFVEDVRDVQEMRDATIPDQVLSRLPRIALALVGYKNANEVLPISQEN